MKKIWPIFFFVCTNALASFNPARTVVPLFKLYDGVRTIQDSTDKDVKVTVYDGKMGIRDGAERTRISEDVYRRAQQWAQGVFLATPGKESRGEADMVYHGTAFHVGGALVLTSQHVLSPSRNNSTSCNHFSVSANSPRQSFSCNKIIACYYQGDWCLMRMNNAKKLSQIPSLSLSESELNPKSVYAAIGNTGGFGMHYSEGKGAQETRPFDQAGPYFKFYAPLWEGNSGGPILNQQGQVVGVAHSMSFAKEEEISHFQRSYQAAFNFWGQRINPEIPLPTLPTLNGDDAYGLATDVREILRILRDTIPATDPMWRELEITP